MADKTWGELLQSFVGLKAVKVYSCPTNSNLIFEDGTSIGFPEKSDDGASFVLPNE